MSMNQKALKRIAIVIVAVLALYFGGRWLLLKAMEFGFGPTYTKFSVDEAREVVLRHTHGCTDGKDPMGVSISAWPGEFSTWMQLTLDGVAVECLKERAHLTECLKGCRASENFMGDPPDWFSPRGQAFTFKGDGQKELCLWQSDKGEDLYVFSRFSGPSCIHANNRLMLESDLPKTK